MEQINVFTTAKFCLYNAYIMNRLNRTKQAQVIAALVEGNSIRAIERITGVAKHTILKLRKDAGIACADYQDSTFAT